jgi:hypothetical protein
VTGDPPAFDQVFAEVILPERKWRIASAPASLAASRTSGIKVRATSEGDVMKIRGCRPRL